MASYNVIYEEQNIVDAAFVYRGWPLYWAVESWSYWSPPPYPYRTSFQLVNFLIDSVFYAVVTQIPIQLIALLRRSKKITDSNVSQSLERI